MKDIISYGQSAANIGKEIGQFGGVSQSGIRLSPANLSRAIIYALIKAPKKALREGAQSLAAEPEKESTGRWGIAESNEGQIFTDWKGASGRIAGLLWWEKEYQTEARHVITINRSYRSADLTK